MGIGRSGSTLLSYLLRHEQFVIETHSSTYIPLTMQIVAYWYELKEKLLFHLPLSLKLKRLE